MRLLIKNIKIVDKQSPLNGEIANILIDNGILVSISREAVLEDNAEVFEAEGYSVSQGWVDVGTHYKDPGAEWLDDLESISEAASFGGYTQVLGFPNTQPVIQTKEAISYFSNFNRTKATQLLNLAAVTKNCRGEDFTDMIDLKVGGAAGFSDGTSAIHNSDIFLKTLIYLGPLQSVFVVKSEDKYLSMYGQMHEGITSTLLGMKGIPSTAEELMIMRNLKLLEYSGVQSASPVLHFSTISTKGSVELIREAKKKGLAVSCDIAAHHLEFTDEDLIGFNTKLKVYPPFRTKEDIEALNKGLADGTIDFVVSDHNSWDEEHKTLEFDAAEFGAAGLQTVFPVLLKGLTVDELVEKIASNPRKIFKLNNGGIVEGQVADITIFSESEAYTLSEDKIKSKGKNSPFLDRTLIGRAKAIFNNGIFKVLD